MDDLKSTVATLTTAVSELNGTMRLTLYKVHAIWLGSAIVIQVVVAYFLKSMLDQ